MNEFNFKYVKPTNKPYYCWTQERGEKHSSLDDFISNWSDADLDYNVIVRFDIEQQSDENDDYNPTDKLVLKVVWLMQRKGTLWQTSCPIQDTKEDLEKLVAFLKPRHDYNQQLWSIDPIKEEEKM